MSAGRANRRLYRPPEGSIIETDKYGNRRVVTWNEIKRQIKESVNQFWQKRPEGVRPSKKSLRQRIRDDTHPNRRKSLPPLGTE